MSYSNQILGGGGGIDANGLDVYTLEFIVATETEARTVGPETHMGVGQKRGGRSWKPNAAGHFLVTVAYEGKPEDDDPETAENFEFLPAKTEVPIEAHPWFEKIMERFGGTLDPQNGQVSFPLYMPGRGAGADGLAGGQTGGSSRRRKNIMHGWESYIKKVLVVRWQFTSRDFPAKWAEQDGQVIESIPGPFTGPAGRDWLVWFGPCKTRGTGDTLAYETTIDFVLSDRGGWPPMYWLIDNL